MSSSDQPRPEQPVDSRPWYARESGHERHMRLMREKAADQRATAKAYEESQQ